MNVSPEPFVVPVILVGALLVADLLLKASLRRTAVPSVVVHLGLGFALALAEWRWGWLDDGGRRVVDFLGSVGIVFLLFRVGLESNVRKLAENLRGASFVWVANMTLSGALGFVVAHHGLALELVPSLFVAVAMTATSVGVGVAVWREEGALGSRRGQLFLDVAELDDISAIVLMAVLFAVAPLLRDGQTDALALSLGRTSADIVFRLGLFVLACAFFARFLEAPLTRLVARLEPAPDRLITVVSVGLVVAAAAGALGFPLAIGAFFGGLAFSRDPEAVKLDAYFDPLPAARRHAAGPQHDPARRDRDGDHAAGRPARPLGGARRGLLRHGARVVPHLSAGTHRHSRAAPTEAGGRLGRGGTVNVAAPGPGRKRAACG
jgi:Kef-type K+ transport system membrane component KefB